MKTKRQVFLAISVATMLMVSCGEKKSENRNEDPKEEMEQEMVDAPDGIISLEKAKILCDNYETRRIGTIKEFEASQNPESEFIPTQFIDFDFETISNYVKYVEQEAKKAKVRPDSLRIYLGNYGKGGKDPNRNTVFMLPTAKIGGENGGFFINEKGQAELIRNYWPKDDGNGQNQGQKSKASFFPSFSPYQGGGSLIMNDGHIAPPPYGDF